MNKYKSFIEQFSNFKTILEEQIEILKNPDYFQKTTIENLFEQNNQLYKNILPEYYEKSYVNPAYAIKQYGNEGGVLAAIFYEFRNLINYIFTYNHVVIDHYLTFSEQVLESLQKENFQKAESVFYKFLRKKSEFDQIEQQFCNLTYDKIVNEADQSLKYIFKYGCYVNQSEIDTAKAFQQWDKEKIKKSGKVIANAYDKGFVMACKNRGDRVITKVIYHLGQGPLALEVCKSLRKIGYEPKVTELLHIGANPQADLDHKDDLALILNQNYLDEFKKHKEYIHNYQQTLSKVAGFVRLLQFGNQDILPALRETTIKYSKEQKMMVKEIVGYERRLLSQYMPKSEMSYTGAAYPNAAISDDHYIEILDAIAKINNMESEKYEQIQEILIKALDKADYIHVKGMNGNQTDIKINIMKLENPEIESAFKNTGADINLPLGEVFTSPVLKSTTGILHVSSCYREQYQYKDLWLKFEDGFVKDYTCKNFLTESENKEYLESTLFYPHKYLPMGEFAIGTNTYAYTVSKKFGIVDKLPGLIVEKMGPHFAIGDTCYAYAEDVEVRNYHSGKMIVAKDNEVSIKRKQNSSDAYFNTHTDITIPFDELEFISVIQYNGQKIDIIKKGKFVLDGTDYLNQYL